MGPVNVVNYPHEAPHGMSIHNTVKTGVSVHLFINDTLRGVNLNFISNFGII